MIVVSLDETLYRGHTPKWASQPLSGAGAAIKGGRFNRPGVHALYLSLSKEGALAEYQQDALLLPPCTLVAYRAQLASVVDFRGGYTPDAWQASTSSCSWTCSHRPTR